MFCIVKISIHKASTKNYIKLVGVWGVPWTRNIFEWSKWIFEHFEVKIWKKYTCYLKGNFVLARPETVCFQHILKELHGFPKSLSILYPHTVHPLAAVAKYFYNFRFVSISTVHVFHQLDSDNAYLNIFQFPVLWLSADCKLWDLKLGLGTF